MLHIPSVAQPPKLAASGHLLQYDCDRANFRSSIGKTQCVLFRILCGRTGLAEPNPNCRLPANGGRFGSRRARPPDVLLGMKRRTYLLIVIAAVALGGCRSDVHRELLERELRWQEEEIDHLEDHVIEYKRRLASLQRENAALREKLAAATARAQPEDRDDAASRRRKTRPPAVDGEPPEVEMGDQAAPPNGPPERAAPGAAMPEGEPAELPQEDSGELPALEPLNEEGDSTGQPATEPGRNHSSADSGTLPNTAPRMNRAQATSSAIHRIVLNREGTHGYDADGQPGDDGIRVVVEPRDRQGRIVHEPGELHIELYAPTTEGEIPVARWIFTSDQTARRLAGTPDGQGMEYILRWPASPPPQRQVKLYVRYLTQNGAELSTEQALVVAPPAAAARRSPPPGSRQGPPTRRLHTPARAAARGQRIPQGRP